MSEFMKENDDDLFDYDPSKEKVSSSVPFSSSSSNSKISNEVYDQISKSIKENDDENFLKANGLRIKFSQAVLNSYDFWISPSSSFTYFSTVSQVLDELTNGRFSDLYLYNYLEANIIRRNHIAYLLNQTFYGNETKDSKAFNDFFDKLGIAVTDAYIATYVGTLIRITNHILSKERSMYLSLATKLNLIPNPAVLDPNTTSDEIFEATQASSSSSRYSMLSSKFNQNIDESFYEKLNNMDGTNISHRLTEI